LAVEENSPKSGSFGINNILTPCPTPSTSSAMRTPDPQSPGPSACLVVTEETTEDVEGDPNTLEPSDEGDIQMEYSSD
jgi:hypothetical protein